MSQDWIKIDKRLADGPKVLRLVELTGLDREAILGRLMLFWSWVDDHVKEDGRLRVSSVTVMSRVMSRVTNCDTIFWTSMCDPDVGWLGEDERGVFIPHWDKWFGESRRKRLLNAERQRRYREKDQGESNGHSGVTSRVTLPSHNALDETRRDESIPSLTLTSTSDGDVGVAVKEIDWEKARDDANEIVRKLHKHAHKRQDRSLLLKAAALAQVNGPDFLWHSVDAVCAAYGRSNPPRKNRFAYLHGVMREKASDAGQNFNLMLKAIDVPEELVAERARDP